jgi:two-component system LytT family sensor kinase
MKRYSKREPVVFLWVMVPYVMGMNLIMFGTCLFRPVMQFFLAGFYNLVYFFIAYFVFGIVAAKIRARYPAAGDLFKRIRIMLPVFYVMNAIMIYGLVLLYANVHLLNCPIKFDMSWWAILYACIMSTGITFLNEGVANLEIWKSSLSETEKLRNMYQRSKVLGLKGQINPHFLFNCFNTLSGLIDEDEEKAERFLDEMTMVHRYLLRKDDEMLVPIKEEMKFAVSYLYLIKQRFGKAIIINTPAIDDVSVTLPPLSMQAVLENIIYTNAISKTNPLTINITVRDDYVEVQHTVHEKTIVEDFGANDGLDNLINKYTLLKAGEVLIQENESVRVIKLPLLKQEEIAI